MLKHFAHMTAFVLLMISLTIVSFIQGSRYGQLEAYNIGVKTGHAEAILCGSHDRVMHNGEVIPCKDLD